VGRILNPTFHGAAVQGKRTHYKTKLVERPTSKGPDAPYRDSLAFIISNLNSCRPPCGHGGPWSRFSAHETERVPYIGVNRDADTSKDFSR
jgi:hypothetical protein